MQADEDRAQQLHKLFSEQGLAVLSTCGGGCPYASLVGFAATNDLRGLLFATSRNTRKYANLMAEPHAAMLIDSRSHQETDFHNAIAVTATGRAEEVAPERREELLPVYLHRHPHLSEFVGAPTCALLYLAVETYYLVERFQHVVEIHVTP